MFLDVISKTVYRRERERARLKILILIAQIFEVPHNAHGMGEDIGDMSPPAEKFLDFDD